MTKEELLKIKARLAEGKTQKEVGEEFGYSRSYISDVCRGLVDGISLNEDTSEIDKLKTEILHLKLERNLALKKLKEAAKQQGLFDCIVDELVDVIEPFESPPLKAVSKPKGRLTEHLVMHMSDGHHDQIVVPSECGGLEKHDFSVSCCRAEKYVDTVLKWTQTTLANSYSFPKLTILCYGDFTSGEIHGAVTRSEFKNQFKNCLAIGELHALMYRDLSTYFQDINVVYVPGNHGRRSKKKDYHGAHDNWDYLIAKIAELHCRDLKNVGFLIPDTFTFNILVENNLFNLSHGDDVRSSLGIPWYGLERRQQRFQLLMRQKDIRPNNRYFCCGHFHTPASISGVDGEQLVNGAWVATDAYAYNSLGKMSEPIQLIHGVNEKHGVTWRLPVKLRDQEAELEGPKRYKIEVDNETI